MKNCMKFIQRKMKNFISDGYEKFSFKELEKFKEYSNMQSSVNKRIEEINLELATIPKMPPSIDMWIDDLPDLRGNSFGLNDYTKLFKYRKEYSKLLETSDHNLREMKILTIDDLLGKIDRLLRK